MERQYFGHLQETLEIHYNNYPIQEEALEGSNTYPALEVSLGRTKGDEIKLSKEHQARNNSLQISSIVPVANLQGNILKE